MGVSESDDRFGVEQVGGVWWLYGGDWRWPCANYRRWDSGPLAQFGGHSLRQAHIMVESGWTLSVIWGTGTYGSNYHAGWDDGPEFTEHPAFVEVAVKAGGVDGKLVGEPLGWVTPGDLAEMVAALSVWPSNLEAPSWAQKGGSYRPGRPAGGYPSHGARAGEVPPIGPPDEE